MFNQVTAYLLYRMMWLLTILGYFVATDSVAQITIGVIGKTKNDSFYQQSFKGCQSYAKKHSEVTCLYDGADDYQDIRGQVIKINQMIANKVDALLISTTDSEYLVKGALREAKEKAIPVITFDSDLLPEHQQYRLSYVGTNNFDFGVALGNYVKKFAKKDLTAICLQSGHPTTPNLNERIAGVRFALSGQKEQKLSGQRGWIESERCPLYSLGKRSTALLQLESIIKTVNPPIFLAVAGFAQFNSDYNKQLSPFKKQIANNQIVIVSADTEEIQLRSLAQGLSTANIGQMPFEMGRKGAELLYQYIKNNKQPAKSHYYLDYHYCTQSNSLTCTTNY